MKLKLAIDLVEPEQFIAGLDIHTVYPKLTTAEKDLAAAERQLATAKADLSTLSRECEALPARVKAGEATPHDLDAALRKQRADALLIPQHEARVVEAKGRLTEAKKAAQKALTAAVQSRRTELEEDVAQLAPILERLRDLEIALGHVLDKRNLGLGITWPRCWKDEGERRGMAAAAAQTNLESAGFKSYADAVWNRRTAS